MHTIIIGVNTMHSLYIYFISNPNSCKECLKCVNCLYVENKIDSNKQQIYRKYKNHVRF